MSNELPPKSLGAQDLESHPGRYHEEGQTVLGVARHSETLAEMAVYRFSEEGRLIVQPLEEFMNGVRVNELPPLSQEAHSLAGGHYRHYKGGQYEVIGVGTGSEGGETDTAELVVYRAEYEQNQLFARPLSMFTETVGVDGHLIPRFTYLD